MGDHVTVFVKKEHLGIPVHLWKSEAANKSDSSSAEWNEHRTSGNKLLASTSRVNMFFDDDYAGLVFNHIRLNSQGIERPSGIEDHMVMELRATYYFMLPPHGPTRLLGYYEPDETEEETETDTVDGWAYLHWENKEGGRYKLEIWARSFEVANELFNDIREGTIRPERNWSDKP